MTRILHIGLATLLTWGLAASALAAAGPDGLWRTIDDETGRSKSLVRIAVVEGRLEGRVEQILTEPDGGVGKLCEHCEGVRHNRPVVGMTILWGLEKDGDWWQGGHILDPANGKEYKARLRVLGDGRTLEVRGYIGISLLGRSQTWYRVD